MPRSTRKGSRGPYKKYNKIKRDWPAIYTKCEQLRNSGDCHAITDTANSVDMNPSTFESRFNKWLKAGRPNAGEGDIGSGCNSTHGGQNRAFDKVFEGALAQTIQCEFIDAHIHITLRDVQLIAVHQWYQRYGHSRRSRSKVFTASLAWCSAFLKRHKVSLKRAGRRPYVATPPTVADEQSFIRSVDAISEFGSEYVLNLDETFWRLINPVLPIYARRGDPSPFINMDGNVKSGLTAACIVAASGKKLPVVIIAEGKTDACLTKFNIQRYHGRVNARYNSSAWMTSSLLVDIINNVIVPYCGEHRAALILDDVSIHIHDSVKAACDAAMIRPLYVPAGLTATRQPLDVGAFGPMKSFARHAWRVNRINHPTHSPSWSDAIEVLMKSWSKVSPRSIRRSFQRSFDMERQPTSHRYPAPTLVERTSVVSLSSHQPYVSDSKEIKREPVVASTSKKKSNKRSRAPSPYVHDFYDPFEGEPPVHQPSSSTLSSNASSSSHDIRRKRTATSHSTSSSATATAQSQPARQPRKSLYDF